MSKKAYIIAYILGSLMLNFTALVIIRFFIPVVYNYNKTGLYTYPMKLLDNVSILIRNPLFVAICLAMFGAGIVFMGALNWIGFGRD